MRRETITTPDDDDLVLDHVDGQIASHRALLLHGLEGSSNSVYIQGMLSLFASRGIPATALNFRSCAREPGKVGPMIPNRRARLYHSGETTDLDFVVGVLRKREPDTPLLAFGGSLGGNVLLKWLGENPEQSAISAAAVVSVPYDLGAGSDHLEDTIGKAYTARFLKTLKPKAALKKRLFPTEAVAIDLPATLRSRTFREFDNAATAPLHGFDGAEDYYQRCSSIRFVAKIRTPTLCINSEDDPFTPTAVIGRLREEAPESVSLTITARGGHVGFIGGTLPWRPWYWAENEAFDWLLRMAGLQRP